MVLLDTYVLAFEKQAKKIRVGRWGVPVAALGGLTLGVGLGGRYRSEEVLDLKARLAKAVVGQRDAFRRGAEYAVNFMTKKEKR
jgi:hypothetical protein